MYGYEQLKINLSPFVVAHHQLPQASNQQQGTNKFYINIAEYLVCEHMFLIILLPNWLASWSHMQLLYTFSIATKTFH